jgi:hypothetical protein
VILPTPRGTWMELWTTSRSSLSRFPPMKFSTSPPTGDYALTDLPA